ncbi:hypothetical protein M595_0863 [Lyngbya aestuarii BL J]|uniref:S-layer family protein n=1 Tax=Lyngbya aestuarii BL J TaxID=1348334 RepID=U7QPH3_9CYAN|nr:hypothetical protein [Lyngbya aestuarii]ERT09177.1 hypothetical protein M595_0863 [Lyngbya aestuarii BL J]
MGGTGLSGNINITANSLSINGGAFFSTSILGNGNAGNINVTAASIDVTGTSPDGEFFSGFFANVNGTGIGNGGNIYIETEQLRLTDGARIQSSTFGQGNAGVVSILATDSVELSNSNIFGNVGEGAGGNGGTVEINTGNLLLSEGARINTSTSGQGNAGNINVQAASIDVTGTSPNGELSSGFFANVNETGMGHGGNIYIETGQLRMTDIAIISSSTFGQGNSGSISIFATDSLELADNGIFSNVGENAVGDGGNIEISTSSLNAVNGEIGLITFGNGNAGNVRIEAQQINLSDSIVTGETSGTGNVGNIIINTGNLVLRDGADIRLDVNPEAIGSTGNITVNASESVNIIGVSPTGLSSRINTRTFGNGNAGSVIINTPRLAVRNGGKIFASSFNTGQAGDVIINASESIEVSGRSPVQIDQESIEFSTEPPISPEDINAGFSEIVTRSSSAEGSTGSVFITTNKLTIQEGGRIGTSASGRGSSGLVEVKANEIEIAGQLNIGGRFSRSSLDVFTNGEGTAGTLNLETGRLTVRDGGNISVLSLNDSSAGSLNIQASVVELIGEGRFPSENGESILSSGIFVTTGTLPGDSSVGSITLEADQLRILNGAQISTFTGNIGSSGLIDIRANTIEIRGRGTRTITSFTGEPSTIGSQISAQAGNGGNTGDILITAQTLIGQDGATIRTDSLGTGSSGSIQIQAEQVLFDDQVFISSGTAGAGNGGNITIETEQFTMQNNSRIFSGISLPPDESEITSVEIPPNRRGGTVFIQASESINVEGEGTSISTGVSEEGARVNGGNVIIETEDLTINNQAFLFTGTQGNGDAGSVNIQAENIELTGSSGISTAVFETGVGNGGNVTIETGDLTIDNRASLSTGTQGNGDAGSVNIQAENIELIDSSFIFANVSETGVGNGGTITVDADELTVRNQSIIGVSSEGEGNPGNIDVNASQVRLEQAGLVAESVTGEGGNITINSPDISVRRESRISAAGSESGQTFDGNIDINSNLLVLLENSEIVTSAFDPTGGSNINIRPLGNSELGLLQSQNSIINAAGELSIDTTLNFDPPESLQVEVVDPAALIAQDPCIQGRNSSFIITGRGGIAPDPTQALSAIQGLVEWESLLIEPVTPQPNNNSSQRPQQQSRNRDNNLDDHPVDSRTIVPARGWIRTEDGEVILVGYDPTKTGIIRQRPNSQICQP